MPFGRIDDGFDGHPKRSLVSLAVDGLLMRAISRASRYLTDGFVEQQWVLEQLARETARQRARVLEEMVRFRVFEDFPCGRACVVTMPRLHRLRTRERDVTIGPFEVDGYLIHDYLHLNPARVEVEEQRELERKKKAGQRAREKQDALPWDLAGSGLSPGDIDPCPPGSPPLRGTPGRGGLGVQNGSSLVSIDARAPELPSGLAAQVETVLGVLAQSPRLHIDRVGIENAIAMYPNCDPVSAAREVITKVTDPAFHATNAAGLLRGALSNADLRIGRAGGHGRKSTSTGDRFQKYDVAAGLA